MTDGMPSKVEMISGKKEEMKNQLEVSLGAIKGLETKDSGINCLVQQGTRKTQPFAKTK